LGKVGAERRDGAPTDAEGAPAGTGQGDSGPLRTEQAAEVPDTAGALRLRLRQQELLAELGTLALRAGDIDALLQDAARLVAQGLGTNFCKILEHLPGEDRLLVRAGVGWREGVVGVATVSADVTCPAGYALRTGDAIISDHMTEESPFWTPQLLQDHGIRRAMNVVIRGVGAAYGVLEADSPNPGDFGHDDLAFMWGAANLLGFAIEHKRTEAAFNALHARTREILESISDAFYAVDQEWRFTYVNRKAEELWGRKREELIGRNFWEEFPQAVGSEPYKAYMRAAREQRVVQLEAVSPILNHWIDLSIYPSQTGLSVYFRDITERKLTEAALRASEERLQLAIESAGIGTWELDLATGNSTRSVRHCAIFGIPSTGTEGWGHEAILEQVVPEDRPLVERIRDQVLEGACNWQMEYRIRRANDGAIRWIEARGAAVRNTPGDPPRLVGVVMDVTERKEAEAVRERFAAELEQRVAERTRELAEANARLTAEIAERRATEAALIQAQRFEAVGQLTGGVAHDFNNLLTAVVGNLQLLRPRQTDPRTLRQVDAALQAAQRGGELTRQLLAYARKQRLEPRPVDANAIVSGMEQLMRRSLGRLVCIETRMEPQPWPALSDPAQLESVLLNLAINARDAMPGGGHLRITTRNVVAGDETLPPELPRGDYVLLSVVDEGSGMPPEVAAKAFEPFFTTKEIGKGSGLGLAQVQGVVRQFGGTVRLRSAVGAGTTVEVFLPRAKEPVRQVEEEDGTTVQAPVAGTRVLVVDDEEDVRAVAVTFLQEAGYAVREAASGLDALRELEDGPVELMLVDYAMAGMSGTEFVRLARLRWPDLPAVYITGNADPLGTGGANPEDRVLAKPYSQDMLLAAVRETLERRRPPPARPVAPSGRQSLEHGR
jgi:PAS domain S-box-containing protein